MGDLNLFGEMPCDRIGRRSALILFKSLAVIASALILGPAGRRYHVAVKLGRGEDNIGSAHIDVP